MKISDTGQQQMATHGVENCSVLMDAKRHLGWVDTLVGSVFDNVQVGFPDLGVMS